MKKLLFTLIFAHCALYPQEVVQDFVPLKMLASFQGEQDGVIVNIDQYKLVRDPEEEQETLRRQLVPPFYPIEITIENNSDKRCCIHPQHTDLAIMPGSTIAQLTGTSSAVKTVFRTGGVASGILIGGGIALVAIPTPGTMIAGVGTFLLGATVFVHTVVYALPVAFAYQTCSNNMSYSALNNAMLHNTVVIEPGEVISKFVFVRNRDFDPTFTLSVAQTDQKRVLKGKSFRTIKPSKLLTFKVDLTEKQNG